MNHHPMQPAVRQFQAFAFTTLMMLGFAAVLQAEPASEKKAPSSDPTNMVIVKAPTSGSTNIGIIKAPTSGSTNITPALPASSSHMITITTDDDDDSASDSSGHSKSSEMSGHDTFAVAAEAILIPIIAILATFGMPVLIVFFICYFKYRRRQENLATVREYINKGLPVPPQLLDDSLARDVPAGTTDYPSRGRVDLRKGVKYTFIGLAICMALYVNNPHTTTWAWGLIPLVIGNGLAISGWIELRHQRKAEQPGLTTPLPPGKPL